MGAAWRRRSSLPFPNGRHPNADKLRHLHAAYAVRRAEFFKRAVSHTEKFLTWKRICQAKSFHLR